MKRRITTLMLLALLVSVGVAAAAELRQPGSKDRCPVCGMFVAPYPNWLATLVFADGSQLFFDGPKDLFHYQRQLAASADGHGRQDITGVYATEYYTTRLMDARTLVYVVGSDVNGPMGKELVPVAGEAAATTFLKDHRGSAILSYEQALALEHPENP